MTLLTGYYADKQNYGEIDLNACADNSKRAYIKYLKDLCKQSISLAKESLTHGHKKEAKNNLNKFYNYHKKLNKINPLSPLEFINYLKDQEIDIAVHKLGDIVTEINSTTGDKSFKTNNKLQYQKDYLIRYITDLANLKDNKSIAIFLAQRVTRTSGASAEKSSVEIHLDVDLKNAYDNYLENQMDNKFSD